MTKQFQTIVDSVLYFCRLLTSLNHKIVFYGNPILPQRNLGQQLQNKWRTIEVYLLFWTGHLLKLKQWRLANLYTWIVWAALSCIDTVEMIPSNCCDTGIGMTEQLKPCVDMLWRMIKNIDWYILQILNVLKMLLTQDEKGFSCNPLWPELPKGAKDKVQ